MLHFAVNWLAVVLATVVAWAFGAAWYMALAKPWLASIGKTADQIDRSDYTPYLWSVLCIFIMAYFLAVLTPALTGATTVANGLLVGAQMWLGFIITAMVLNHRYQGAPWSRTLIDGGYLLGVLLLAGVVIGLFG
ncbi:DUF1761 domain-containing protein [Devosia beringensis]|uniref:DUF1761 domain-containing protein n=1 Tax=Devosia beringensis TaxID=2657486 RepID=UPI00186B980F|nr:DUF1761 domain-containing protein [Devosia beringensis]